ncbi:hypothetical protein [Encephalitozoon cuniculi GB-M1]|uniref:Uncharacterized protein n=2 Tax=Encephalitozoon cuniculi TaxID=6035 RepID=Q8SWN1_ENCCU|nr:uncharacterized protein ECU01_0550 [Encephalitozoon cuniculi GB-M1]AGE96060.1 hypothetical protein ECU01_0550 [Encephalitozoon cuniculi]KMV66709.1 hypothetical protein M970_010380 [Encephalitozoon cuniculi EcunIII-L]UYI28424.1 hypothetical protein J0A71_11g23360 [Encephalitozoon cuniculi]CAD24925.1 hypothetical protein [Encephalitozoon cuniculi GB-M1]
MKELVDVLYYDYILYKLASLYTLENAGNEVGQYQKIAQKLLVKLRSDKVVFDAEVGLKFAYIKLYDLHLSFPKCTGRLHVSCCQKHYLQFLGTSYDYLTKIMAEYSSLKECIPFNHLLNTVVTMAFISSPTLEHFVSLNRDEGFEPMKPYLARQGIKVDSEEDFGNEKERLLKTLKIKAKDENKLFNKTFQYVMDELKKIFLSFDVPLLQFFGTSEVIQLKELYPNAFEGLEELPASSTSYKEEILKEYLDVRNSLSKTRSAFINPKDKGEKILWGSDTSPSDR